MSKPFRDASSGVGLDVVVTLPADVCERIKQEAKARLRFTRKVPLPLHSTGSVGAELLRTDEQKRLARDLGALAEQRSQTARSGHGRQLWLLSFPRRATGGSSKRTTSRSSSWQKRGTTPAGPGTCSCGWST